MLDVPGLEKTVDDARQGLRGTYFDPVALMVALLGGDARRFETFSGALDAVTAGKTSLALASKTNMQRKCMAQSARRGAHQRLHRETEGENGENGESGVNDKTHGRRIYEINLRVFLQVQDQDLTHLARGGRAFWEQTARFPECIALLPANFREKKFCSDVEDDPVKFNTSTNGRVTASKCSVDIL